MKNLELFNPNEGINSTNKKKNLEVIDFKENINNKLLCFSFVCVLDPDFVCEHNQQFQIKINKKHMCFAEVVDVSHMFLEELVISNLYMLDAGKSIKEYKEYVSKNFGEKKSLTVVWFKKITQLNLLDNNDIYNTKTNE